MRWIPMLAASLVCAAGARVDACPLCDSDTGAQVRAGIFDEQFWPNVLRTLLPFPILLLLTALIYFDVSWLRNKPPAPPAPGE